MEQQTPLVVLMEDDLIHTDEHPYCSDRTCPCHRNSELDLEYLVLPWFDGFMTSDETLHLFRGQQIAYVTLEVQP